MSEPTTIEILRSAESLLVESINKIVVTSLSAGKEKGSAYMRKHNKLYGKVMKGLEFVREEIVLKKKVARSNKYNEYNQDS